MAKKAKALKIKKDFADQFDDEEVLFLFRKHPVVMRKGLVISMLAILAGTIPALIKPELSYFYGGLAGGFILAVLLFVPSWIVYWYSVFIVTNQRFIQITQKGFFNKSVVDIGLSKIQSTNYEIKGVQATLLGFGTIMIQTYMGDLVVHEVHHPAEVIRKISEILRAEGIEAEVMDPEELQQQKGNNEEAIEEI
jgi:hypothetical protein